MEITITQSLDYKVLLSATKMTPIQIGVRFGLDTCHATCYRQ